MCANQLFRAERERADDVRLDRRLYRACSGDMRRWCEGVDEGAPPWPCRVHWEAFAACAALNGCMQAPRPRCLMLAAALTVSDL